MQNASELKKKVFFFNQFLIDFYTNYPLQQIKRKENNPVIALKSSYTVLSFNFSMKKSELGVYYILLEQGNLS